MTTTVVQRGGVLHAADVSALLGDRPPPFLVEEADAAARKAYYGLRHEAFVERQGLFARTDLDDRDDDSRTVVLVARDRSGAVVGGVRLGPATPGLDVGWWQGGRLVTAPTSFGTRVAGVGAALVRAACARAEAAGALRFDATVQLGTQRFFQRLGWETVRPTAVANTPHVLMRWPILRIAQLVAATKSELGSLLQGIGPVGFVGDDGAPVPGSDLVAACDAIVPAMVERDPEWAGWCSVLVNVNDLAAMGAVPVGLLDALGARDAASAERVLRGLKRAAAAYGVPILGGHTQLGVPAALGVTALGRTARPVAGGGGRPGEQVRLTADLGGGWRPGYVGRQWDSTTYRRADELRAMTTAVGRAQPSAAKDVSMAGVVGTLGMLAEASGCAAVLDVAAVPKPRTASMGDWLTCFPGFAMLTTGPRQPEAGPAMSSVCGELTTGQGVALRWPDGEVTTALTSGVTGMGAA
ncbi:MSMEG_0567/sll0787 family protein [Kribbella sp.]|uniref:MSMEG_0567/sll0787 family protein n=1 Tax=Kribbella sp. TaxID=1871183 RepID=UPI002D5D81A7|nr:MSMEG_0567/sll0787 family protein [Kribbella sp.]HZX05197.1 MSMEG_0567/sll0787 family protein [Kribbella sp.]